MTLLKHTPYKSNVIRIWENLHMYKHKGNDQLIIEKIQIQNIQRTNAHNKNVQTAQLTVRQIERTVAHTAPERRRLNQDEHTT